MTSYLLQHLLRSTAIWHGVGEKQKKEKKYALNFIWNNFAKHLDKEGFKVPVSDPGSDILITFNKKMGGQSWWSFL